MNNVVFLRLKTGEECLAVEKNGKYENCAVLVPNGKGGIAIMQWLPYVEESKTGLEFAEDTIAFKGTPVEDLMNEYKNNFLAQQSDLYVPPQQLIV